MFGAASSHPRLQWDFLLLILLLFALWEMDEVEAKRQGGGRLTNQEKGDRAERKVAKSIRRDLLKSGEHYERHVRVRTPFGDRILDGGIFGRRGELEKGVEVKSGKSRYGGEQMKKDEWIEKNHGIPIDLWHLP